VASNEREIYAWVIAGHIEAMVNEYPRVDVMVHSWNDVETYVRPRLDYIDVSFTIK
jgi:hypothetical protein